MNENRRRKMISRWERIKMIRNKWDKDEWEEEERDNLRED